MHDRLLYMRDAGTSHGWSISRLSP
ncbi:hypothetical protein [Serratia marcescens]